MRARPGAGGRDRRVHRRGLRSWSCRSTTSARSRWSTGLRAELARGAGRRRRRGASSPPTRSPARPGWDTALAEACLADDEQAAREAVAGVEAVMVYPATKAALAWWARRRASSPSGPGAGIRLNSVAPGADRDPDDRADAGRPGLRPVHRHLPERDRPARPPRGGRRGDRLPALRRGQPASSASCSSSTAAPTRSSTPTSLGPDCASARRRSRVALSSARGGAGATRTSARSPRSRPAVTRSWPR